MARQRQGRRMGLRRVGCGNETLRLFYGQNATERLANGRGSRRSVGLLERLSGPGARRSARLGNRPAVAALRQPEDGSRESTRGTLEGSRHQMGISTRWIARGNYRRIRNLAQGTRFRRRGGLGAPYPIVGAKDRARGAGQEGREFQNIREARDRRGRRRIAAVGSYRERSQLRRNLVFRRWQRIQGLHSSSRAVGRLSRRKDRVTAPRPSGLATRGARLAKHAPR